MRAARPRAVWLFLLLLAPSGVVPSRASSPGLRGEASERVVGDPRSPALRAAWVRAVQAEAPASFAWSGAGVARSGGVQWEVGASGLSVRDDAGWSLRLATRRVGREGALRALPAPAVRVVGNDARLERAGWVERWVHGALGVEQLLEVAERPAGEGALVVELGVSGLTPSLEGGAVHLADAGGVRARYGELWVEDADGAPIPSELAVVGGAIQLRVDDRAARYPIVIDPLVGIEEARLEADDGSALDAFGFAVAVRGDTALVGAYRDDSARGVDAGAAYVFVRSGRTRTQQARLEASDGAADDAFGASVALAGDTAIVGAFQHDTAGGLNAGAAYVFVRSGATWTEQAKLEASDGTAYASFGVSVAVTGDTLLVGARDGDAARAARAGAAYVFVRSGTSWTEQARIRPADGATGDFFGSAVSVQGDVALVGAPRHSTSRGGNVGSAYLITRRGTSWGEQSRIDASDGAAVDLLGTAVALDGDTALVGAPLDDTAPGRDVGSAYVFRLGPGNGEPCASGAACASGFCVDGVCCDTACGGGAGDDCQACSVAAGASSNGACGPTTGNACSDESACTVVDACASGVCAGAGSPCLGGTACSVSGASFTCAPCPAGTSSTDGTGATACAPCAAGTFAGAGATSCATWSPCAAAEYESAAPSATRDRACARCTVCRADEREVTPCGATADTVCASRVDAGLPDAGAGVDAGTPAPAATGGCGCAVPGPSGVSGAGLVLAALFGLVVSRRGRRARGPCHDD